MSSKDFLERNEKSLRDREVRVKDNLKVKESMELQECTFKPELKRSKSARKWNSTSRTLKQFLEDQMRFEESRKSRQVVRAEHSRVLKSLELTLKPEIDPFSTLLVEQKRMT